MTTGLVGRRRGKLNLEFVQAPSGGGAGASNSYTCPAPGATVKWVMDAQVATSVIVGDEVTITVIAVGATNATKTEDLVLHWGLPTGGDD